MVVRHVAVEREQQPRDLGLLGATHENSSSDWRICWIRSRSRRRSALAASEWKPVRQLPLRSPWGAPGERPPWVLHRPFGIAGPWQIVPRRVLAPHLAAERAASMPGRQVYC